jgi:hypothetical protein
MRAIRAAEIEKKRNEDEEKERRESRFNRQSDSSSNSTPTNSSSSSLSKVRYDSFKNYQYRNKSSALYFVNIMKNVLSLNPCNSLLIDSMNESLTIAHTVYVK